MNDKKLKMSFDPHTIEHLGIKMYSVLPNAIAELIANAYDADATEVHIRIINTKDDKRIIVSDNGVGMTFNDINENFLRIGRKRRESDNGISLNKNRKVTGRKGLGKLAFFGIGDIIRIKTFRNGEATSFILNWNELIGTNGNDYEPKFHVEQCDTRIQGTNIELCSLKRKSDIDLNNLAISLSKLFNFFDEDFLVDISYNGEKALQINNELKYNNIDGQFYWEIPVDEICDSYFSNYGISGTILATEKPLKPGLRGITLYAHGRLVNAPEFFGVGESSHGYSYLTGWLNVDFIDEGEEDVISTDRQSLSWDLPQTAELQHNLQLLLKAIERDWRDKRKSERRRKITEKTKVDVNSWFEKLPGNLQNDVETIVNSVVENSELPQDKQEAVVAALHSIVPEYAYYHWRHIHPEVQNASFTDYTHADYYRAAIEAIKRFEKAVQKKSGIDKDGQSLMSEVFGPSSKLSVTRPYKRIDGSDFSDSTVKNIEDGQKFMSMGVMAGARNPLAHEEIQDLKGSSLFTEKDCLDILSLLSHLFRRLDDA